jgi:hypothetical protein
MYYTDNGNADNVKSESDGADNVKSHICPINRDNDAVMQR